MNFEEEISTEFENVHRQDLVAPRDLGDLWTIVNATVRSVMSNPKRESVTYASLNKMCELFESRNIERRELAFKFVLMLLEQEKAKYEDPFEREILVSIVNSIPGFAERYFVSLLEKQLEHLPIGDKLVEVVKRLDGSGFAAFPLQYRALERLKAKIERDTDLERVRKEANQLVEEPRNERPGRSSGFTTRRRVLLLNLLTFGSLDISEDRSSSVVKLYKEILADDPKSINTHVKQSAQVKEGNQQSKNNLIDDLNFVFTKLNEITAAGGDTAALVHVVQNELLFLSEE